MSVIVVIGAQWGDEGKGKIVDYLSQKADMCVRFGGGANAGHTVKLPEEFKLHLVPCGIFNPKTICVIGNGVAVNPEKLIKEMDDLESRGVSCRSLRISNKAHLVMPWHLILDGLQEEERGEEQIGTTREGIGPVFSDKIGRFGFRMEDLISENMEQRLKKLWQRAAKIIWEVYGYSELVYERILKNLLESRPRLLPFIAETEPLIWKACDEGRRVLMEGAQGVLLDPDFGTYPNVTSSPCTLAGALQGSGLSWQSLRKAEVIGVVKAYTTRVCDKHIPFKTEMPDEIANPFREKAGEFGATTGRPRRIGWLDTSLLKYAARLNGFTSLAVTRMDTLGSFLPKVKIWNGFEYIEMQAGWGHDVKSREARDYLNTIVRLVGVHIEYISYGPARNQIFVKKWYSW